MLKTIGRDNLLVMLSLLIWALGEGLWMNLRQLYLVGLGAGPVEVGTALAMENIGKALILLPAGYFIDRIGARQMMLASWLLGIVGVGAISLAQTWFAAAAGMMIYGSSAFALPAISAYALLSSREVRRPGDSQGLLTVMFASYPMGMIISPTLGGWLADAAGIRACVIVACAMGSLSTMVVLGTRHFDPHPRDAGHRADALLRNRGYLWRVIYFACGMFALMVGASLLPNFLADVRGLALEDIGLMFSVLALGTTLTSLVVGRLPARWSYPVVLALVWLALVVLWQVGLFAGIVVACCALGAIYSSRALAMSGLEQVVAPQDQGMAFSALEMLSALTTALAAQLAGGLYRLTPGHDLPMLVGIATLPILLIVWFAARLWHGEPASGPIDMQGAVAGE